MCHYTRYGPDTKRLDTSTWRLTCIVVMDAVQPESTSLLREDFCMPASSPATPPVAAATSAEKTSVSLVGVMCCVMLGPFVNILDYNVVNVSLPKMMSGLATDVLTIRWVVTAFLISTAVSMPTLGWLGRTIGNKNLYILGLVVFTTATGLV